MMLIKFYLILVLFQQNVFSYVKVNNPIDSMKSIYYPGYPACNFSKSHHIDENDEYGPVTNESPIVTITNGDLLGTTERSLCNESYYAFYGIPYAQPPIGNLRFKIAQPPKSWKGLRPAVVEGSVCMQPSPSGSQIVGSEDCLFVNVFTKDVSIQLKSSVKKPVMVWFHRGAYRTGSGNRDIYGASYLMCKDIVLVTCNYRLNTQGFLSFDDPSVGVPGNFGIKDKIRVLQWVQKNIVYFNGDPKRVTIFGATAGAASVSLLTLAPRAKGLFHAAISEGSTVLQPFIYTERPYKKLAQLLGYTGDLNNQSQIFQFINATDGSALISAQLNLVPLDKRYADFQCQISVVIEYPNRNAIITKQPLHLLKEGNFIKVPYIIGFNTDKGASSLNYPTNIEYNFTDNRKVLPKYLGVDKSSPKGLAFGNKIKQFYYGNEQPSRSNIRYYVKMMTDSSYLPKIVQAAKLYSYHTNIFFYEFSCKTDLNWRSRLLNSSFPNANYADETGYLFNVSYNALVPITPGSSEYNCVFRLINFWTNHAARGNPNDPYGNDSLLDVNWKPISKLHFNNIIIDENLQSTTNILRYNDRLSFWYKLEKCARLDHWRWCLKTI